MSSDKEREIEKARFLFELALKSDEVLKQSYERLNEKKVSGLIAGTAIQRKLLGLIYTLWKNDAEYIENYEMKKAS